MNTHPITEPMRQITLQAMRNKGVNQTQMAESVGNGKAWVTKFLDGSLKTIKDENMLALEELLGIRYFSIEKATGERSPLANKIAASVDADPSFAKLAAALNDALTQARGAFTPRYIPTQDMTRLGKEIIKLCAENPEKPGKIAREVLKILA